MCFCLLPGLDSVREIRGDQEIQVGSLVDFLVPQATSLFVEGTQLLVQAPS